MSVLTRPMIARALNVAAFAVLVGWIGYAALGTNVFSGAPWPSRIVDYTILYEDSRSIVATGQYPHMFVYPPPAVILQYATAPFSFPVSAAIYLALHTAAAIACWVLLLGLVRRNDRPNYAIGLIAFVASSSFFLWELRSQNCNIFFLLAILLFVRALHRGSDAAAGGWLALSFSLKLYSLLVIPYLLWKGRLRAFAWTVAAAVVLWGLAPIAVFGISGVGGVYGEWLHHVRTDAAPAANFAHPILISLHNSAAWIARGDPLTAALILYGVRALWLLAAATGWWASRRRVDQPGDPHGLLADVGALTLAPTALSPYLEPYHVLAYAIPVVLLLDAAVDPRQRRGVRIAAATAAAAGLLMALWPKDWHMRGLWTNANLLVVATTAVIVARYRADRSVVSAPRQPVGWRQAA